MADLKTNIEWAAEGRIVKNGAKPDHYLIGPGIKKALYRRSDTVDRSDLEVVKRTDLPSSQPKGVKYRYDGKTVTIWVGSRKDLIAALKKQKFRYNPRTGRWWREVTPKQLERGLDGIRKLGYTLVNEDLTTDNPSGIV